LVPLLLNYVVALYLVVVDVVGLGASRASAAMGVPARGAK
jgi:hypothetical protein